MVRWCVLVLFFCSQLLLRADDKNDSNAFFIKYVLPHFADDLSSICRTDITTTEVHLHKNLPFAVLELNLVNIPNMLINSWANGSINWLDFQQVPQRFLLLDLSVSKTQSYYRPQILAEMRRQKISFLKIDAFYSFLQINFIVTGALLKDNLPQFPGKTLIKEESLIESWLQCHFDVQGATVKTIFNSALIGTMNLTWPFNSVVSPSLTRNFTTNPFLNIPFTLQILEDRLVLKATNIDEKT